MANLNMKQIRSNNFSRFVRTRIEKVSIRQVIGVNLASLAFFGAFIVPQTQNLVSSTEVYFDTQQTTVNMVVTESQFRWPLGQFGISQFFTGFHPGVDLTDPAGTPIYPIADGTITAIETLPWGYGKHIIISHTSSITALYAHLSNIEVKEGQQVSKKTEIGRVGNTGWATGNHLHLEIHVDGVPVNPMEILPEIKKFQNTNISEINVSTPPPYLSL